MENCDSLQHMHTATSSSETHNFRGGNVTGTVCSLVEGLLVDDAAIAGAGGVSLALKRLDSEVDR